MAPNLTAFFAGTYKLAITLGLRPCEKKESAQEKRKHKLEARSKLLSVFSRPFCGVDGLPVP